MDKLMIEMIFNDGFEEVFANSALPLKSFSSIRLFWYSDAVYSLTYMVIKKTKPCTIYIGKGKAIIRTLFL